MSRQNLIKVPNNVTSSPSPTKWISPLQYLKPASIVPPAPPPLPPPPPEPERRRSRFISHADAVRLINRQTDPQQALDLFNAAAAQPGFAHNHATYSALLLKLARHRRFPALDALLRRMSLEPCLFHEAVFLRLMPLLCRASLPDKAVHLFRSAIPLLVRRNPSLKALATCLDALVETRRFDLAQDLLSDARAHFSIEPNTCVCNILVKHHCMSRDLDSAFRVLEEMRASEGDMEKAIGLLGLMLGRGFRPHFVTSNKLLLGLCEVGRVADATVALYGLAEMGFMPESETWFQLVDSVCRVRKLKRAFDLFDDLLVAE
ncbi:hypothetical protein OPV22_006493 [Ensete ventricosum]|uniref:Pentacotripeptide-repeat region of PRORP domain-containing protein n=1 Tax=Ensete ventricosum TaxID=4639 RepID=A0AAV8RLG7_ENSVE|nr:hypothetical protein OPV22_006493 [Ensete ventricosum]